jgi:outer membrane protein
MKKYIPSICLVGLLLWSASAKAQERLSLQACIEYSWKNSLRVQQAQLSVQQTQLQEKQAYWARYPSASANVQHGFNLGRSIDLTSYQFVNQLMQSTSISVGVNVPIYNGLQLRNNLARTRIDVQASEQDVAQAKNDLALSTAQAYLSVLLAEASAEALREQIKITQAQYERAEKLIKAGTLPDNARFDLEAQIARDEQNIVIAENNIALAYLNLKVLINYSPAKDIQIESVNPAELIIAAEAVNAESVYDEAQKRMPNLLAARLRESSALMNVKVAEGSLLPSVSAYFNIATNYSSTGTYFTGDTTYVVQNLTGELNGAPFVLAIPQAIPERANSPFFRQLGENTRQGMGISAQIPIFNGFQSRIRIQQAQLSVKIAQLSTSQLQVQLQSDIQRAVLDVKGSQKRLAAAEKSLKATENAVANTQKRFDLGVVNAFEYTSALNTLTSAKSNLLQAQYDYLFKLKILDFYQGKTISF